MKTESNQNPAPNKELRRLVDGLLNDCLCRTEFARLEELLESDPSARAYYLEIAGTEALIPMVLEGGFPVDLTTPTRASGRKWIRRGVAAAVAAAVVIAAGGIFWWNSHSPRPSEERPIGSASVTGMVGVKLVAGSSELLVGDSLGGETARIEAGLLEVTYDNGVQLLIEGPASFEVTGENAGRLEYGNLVAKVPPGAEGFTIDYAGDRLVDHGTEFGLRVPRDSGGAEVAVFRGEVEVFPGSTERSAHLFRDHAVRREATEEAGLVSVPLDRSLYVREFPSRELPWEIPPVPRGEEAQLEFDVSNLIRSAGDYRFVFKWMAGEHATHFTNVELRLDGNLISSDSHVGRTGDVQHTHDNIFVARVEEAQFGRGRWTVQATAWCAHSTNSRPEDNAVPSNSLGVLLVEEGLSASNSEEDYLGRWEYWHDGVLWVRELMEDGKAVLIQGDRVRLQPTWEIRGGVLEMHFPNVGITEELLLRDRNTLVFVDRPYRNAARKP